MATLTVPNSMDQLLELARQLTPDERWTLLDRLLAERFDAVLCESDRRRGSPAELTDEDIEAEVDAVRHRRREDRQRAAGGWRGIRFSRLFEFLGEHPLDRHSCRV